MFLDSKINLLQWTNPPPNDIGFTDFASGALGETTGTNVRFKIIRRQDLIAQSFPQSLIEGRN